MTTTPTPFGWPPLRAEGKPSASKCCRPLWRTYLGCPRIRCSDNCLMLGRSRMARARVSQYLRRMSDNLITSNGLMSKQQHCRTGTLAHMLIGRVSGDQTERSWAVAVALPRRGFDSWLYRSRLGFSGNGSRETSDSELSRTNLRSVPRLRTFLNGRSITRRCCNNSWHVSNQETTVFLATLHSPVRQRCEAF